VCSSPALRPGQQRTVEIYRSHPTGDSRLEVKEGGEPEHRFAFSPSAPENATGNWVKVVQRVRFVYSWRRRCRVSAAGGF